MVTKLADGRGQTTVKGREIDDEWEALVKKAADRSGLTFAGFIVAHTREAAQAILKGQPAVPAAVPIRLEDLATGLSARIDAMAEEQREALHDRLDRIERASRRGRWRR